MTRDEPLHRAIQLRELALDRIELASRVELAAKRVADVMHAARGAMRELEAAAARAAKRAARMLLPVRRRREIARARPGVCQGSELVVVEQLGRDAGAACTAGVMADGPGLPLRARAARPHVGEPRRYRELSRVHGRCERAFFVIDVAGKLRPQPRPQRDELVRARRIRARSRRC